ncbi:hypothetical protein GGR28_001862 [Lewinella aquimaris]|uniref:Heparinase II/III-like protein n=1 Tax=Neolewinella aquimaris TaxID=1835722 RepID=A0A840E694_9BACT|nr:heparinase II/III family protein [Neolewinella aquimaris]MBB4079242.1 hypothetical protein [Neolewinella aquimaris]
MNYRLATLLLFFLPLVGWAQRPMIWVRADERTEILQRIQEYPQVGAYYESFQQRVAGDLARHAADPAAYLLALPFDLNARTPGAIPPLKTYLSFQGKDNEEQDVMQHYLHTGIDCAMLYWLTREEKYARYAADVLHTFVGGLLPLTPGIDHHNAGWIYSEDHLREAREIGAQLPIIYDFIHDYLVENGTVFDLGTGSAAMFNREGAQHVFRTYAKLAVEQGIINCNWPILEMPSLLHNTLALDDPAERAEWLKYVTETSTDHQDAFPKIAELYENYGGTWPESFGYAQHVSQNLTYILTVLKHYDPSSQFLNRYPAFVAALPQARYFTYPDGKQTILFGDGHRPYHPLRDGLEMAFHLAGLSENLGLREEVGALLAYEKEEAGYRRFQLPERDFGASVYREPLTMLWYEPEVDAPVGNYPLPVTDELPFAGITLQRNLSATGDPRDAFMYFVGGAGFVHGHASGMNMEVYGKGEVLGAKSGRSQYRTDIHENYYRLFASHNTVVVNGASQGDGGWVNLGIETVQREAAEPAPKMAALTDRYAFSTSSFQDNRGSGDPARQQRTMAIVRTTDTTGYYVDVYRSRTESPEQYHDYIYHNIGDDLRLSDGTTGADLRTKKDPNRFAASAHKFYKSNRSFRDPGWHFFDKVRTAAEYSDNVAATFEAKSLHTESVRMRVHLPGGEDRSYTSAMAPPSTESPAPYDKLPTPTLVVRKQGEAWDDPFVAVLEPGEGQAPSALSVQRIGETCCGIEVSTGPEADYRRQYILALDDTNARYVNADYAIGFRGRFALLDTDRDGRLLGLYVGEGQELSYQTSTLTFADGATGAAYVDLSGAEPVITSHYPLQFKHGGTTTAYKPKK